MRMEDFHCETLELSLRINAEDIDREALLKEAGEEDEEDLELPLLFGSKENPEQQHAHISVRFRLNNRVSIRIVYHNTRGDVDDEHPPFMEECAQWLGRFIKRDRI